MINLFLKHQRISGAVTLVMALILILLSSLIVIYASYAGILLDKTTSNYYKNLQAYNAAEAGEEYAINYLQQNSTTIIASAVNGLISYTNAALTNVTLTNNSTFSITYTNPTQNIYNLLQITSTGVNADGSSTHVIKQLVRFGSTLVNIPQTPMTTLGTLTMGGSSEILNLQSSTTVQSGSTVSLSGSALTLNNIGIGSNAAHLSSDVQQNVSSLASMSSDTFFGTFFGVGNSVVKNSIAHYYSNNSDTNYTGTLNGMTGTSIWIDQTAGTAKLDGAAVIGSPTNPVLLIVNGNLKVTGSLVLYGFLYVTGTTTTDVLGSVSIMGSVATADSLNMKGSAIVNYNSSVLSNLQNQSAMMYYARVSGSWKDF